MNEPASDDGGELPDGAELPLENLQRWMQAVLVHPLGHGTQPPVRLLPPAWQPRSVEALVRPSQRLTAREHLAIYQRSYLARLRDCMSAQFSALAYALGADLFVMFADQYLQEYPSESYTLNELGRRFPDFLEETRPATDAAEREPWPEFMIELARFEFAIATLFDTLANENDRLADNGTADAKLQLNPVSQLFQHRYPVAGYYREFTGGRQPELPLPATSYAIVVRKNYRLGLFDLQPLQYRLLLRMSSGNSFPETRRRMIADRILNPEQFDEVWPAWKERWLAAGFFLQIADRSV